MLGLVLDRVYVGPPTKIRTGFPDGILNKLRAQQVRVALEFSNDKLMGRIHHILVIGQQSVKPRAEVLADILAAIRERRARVEPITIFRLSVPP